jgi:hypothetical protein
VKNTNKEHASVESEVMSSKNDTISYGDNIFNGSDILVFELDDENDINAGRYILIIKKNDILLHICSRGTFTYKAKIINNKIVSDEFPENVYVIKNGNLDNLNPDTGELNNTYNFVEYESTCKVEKYFH